MIYIYIIVYNTYLHIWMVSEVHPPIPTTPCPSPATRAPQQRHEVRRGMRMAQHQRVRFLGATGDQLEVLTQQNKRRKNSGFLV